MGSKENFDLGMENLGADLLQVHAIGHRYGEFWQLISEALKVNPFLLTTYNQR